MEQKLYHHLLLFSGYAACNPKDKQLVTEIIETLDFRDHSYLIDQNLEFISQLINSLEDYLNPGPGNHSAEKYSSIMEKLSTLSEKLSK